MFQLKKKDMQAQCAFLDGMPGLHPTVGTAPSELLGIKHYRDNGSMFTKQLIKVDYVGCLSLTNLDMFFNFSQPILL